MTSWYKPHNLRPWVSCQASGTWSGGRVGSWCYWRHLILFPPLGLTEDTCRTEELGKARLPVNGRRSQLHALQSSNANETSVSPAIGKNIPIKAAPEINQLSWGTQLLSWNPIAPMPILQDRSMDVSSTVAITFCSISNSPAENWTISETLSCIDHPSPSPFHVRCKRRRPIFLYFALF